jgi:chemotaxis methyl-accepting protein methylase
MRSASKAMKESWISGPVGEIIPTTSRGSSIEGGRILLLDVSTEWQKVAKKRLRRFQNVDFLNSDIRSSGLSEGSFDVIVISNVLHDIDPSQRQPIVQALAAKLGPRGSIYLRERTGKSHGISVEEIRQLMTGAQLKERSATNMKRQFKARFTK